MTKSGAFLRSINLVYDAESPERVAHFQPTAKCVGLLKNLAGLNSDRAFFITAPYGSGKSLSAAYLLHLVQNRPEARRGLRSIQRRVKAVSPELLKFANRYARNPRAGGIVMVLEGYQEDVGDAFKSAAVESLRRIKLGRQAATIEKISGSGADVAIRVLDALRDKAIQAKRDRVVIIWDEFGRHLERLVAAGQAARLGDIQLVAEYVSRSDKLPMTFSAIMHQGLLTYAGSMSQSSLAAWRKVEGRFTQIQYVDDSKELYQLIGTLVHDRVKSQAGVGQKGVGKQLRELGIFNDFMARELDALLLQAWPLEPLTLYLLPRLAARVAQNERTLFGFLYSADLGQRVSPADLYDYFEPAMRSDTSVGGAYRSWLETESAISKAASAYEVDILKTTCLLSLGLAGERTRASKELLELALTPAGGVTKARKSISGLLAKKLLLHRKHANQIAIWHGTDVDLRGRVAEEQAKFGQDFDLEEFLAKEFPPPTWRPTIYNDKYQLRRFFVSRYLTPRSLKAWLDEQVLKGPAAGSDGEIVYVLCDQEQDATLVAEYLQNSTPLEQVVLAVPGAPFGLRDAALEVACLERMQVDESLLDRDPLVGNELHQMLDDSRAHLARLLQQLVWPGDASINWYHKGQSIEVRTSAELRAKLSNLMQDVFPKTPRFNNEMIVRHRPTPTIVNSRKKLLLGILERNTEERLGIQGEFADAAIFRAVLLHSGLYRQDTAGRWRFAQPAELVDEGLRELWGKFEGFLTTPEKGPKDLTQFFIRLQGPPWGVRRGVLPILIAAALKAFPSALMIVRANGEYVGDLLPSEIEDICKSPSNYRLTVLPVGEEEREYLQALTRQFSVDGDEPSPAEDLLRACYDAVELWKHSSPPGALTSRLVSRSAQELQLTLQKTLSPTDLFFGQFPKIVKSEDRTVVAAKIAALQDELANVSTLYGQRVERALRTALGFGASGQSVTLRELIQQWLECLPQDLAEQIEDGRARAFLNRLSVTHPSDDVLLNAVATLIAGKAPASWDDAVLQTFERELQDIVSRVEEQALQGTVASTGLIQRRIQVLVTRLEDIVGQEQARDTLNAAFGWDLHAEETADGKPARSTG